MHETTVDNALQEMETTLTDLMHQRRSLQAIETASGIYCHRHWNPAAKTFTYHTHVVVAGIGAPAVAHLSTLFFNAYSLRQHGWYSQFSSGAMRPLSFTPQVQGEHQLGQGYFDFGVGALRRYHVLFSRVRIDAQTHAVVLRSVEEDVPVLQASKQVFILPPTGDVFSLDAAGLHWHHICTTSGVRLLTAALTEPGRDNPSLPAARLEPAASGWTLYGQKHMVVSADRASAVLLSALIDDELVLLAINPTAPNVKFVPQHVTTGEPQFSLVLDGPFVTQDDIVACGADARCAVQSMLQHTLVANSVMTLGVTDTMLKMTAAYTSQREQFGRPIATFQAVSHCATDAYIDVQNLRLACQQAASLLSTRVDATEAVMIAKIRAADVAHRLSQSSQHLHGGIGVDRDYPLFRFCLWAKQLELTLGGGNSFPTALGDAIADAFKLRAGVIATNHEIQAVPKVVALG